MFQEKYKELVKSRSDKIDTHQTPPVAHQTVKEVFTKYPNIKLPKNCLKMDIAPCVELTMDEVESYLKQRNRDMAHLVEALKLSQARAEKKIATKKTIDFTLQKKHVSRKDLPKSAQNDEKLIKHNPISPISIKLTNPEKTEYTIVKHNNESKINRLKIGVRRRISSSDNSPNRSEPSTSKKRRISASSTDSDRKENTRPNLIESLGLTPTKNVTNNAVKESLMQVSHTARSLEICNICSSVHYHLKDLKRHQLKHLRCQFCKSKFKTMTLKEEHIKDNCIIKKTMNSVPDVVVKKIEYDLEVRMTYPNAFDGFPSIPGLVLDSEDKETDSETNSKISIIDDSVSEEKTADSDDIIEILSDDDEPTPSTTPEETRKPSEGFNDLTTKSPVENVLESQDVVNSVSTNSAMQQHIDKPFLKPDIKIKDSSILDTVDPKATDSMVLKELLKNYKKLKLVKDAATQPEIPSQTSIEAKPNVFAATLKDLRKELLVYRIPVTIKNGPAFTVAFKRNEKQEKPRKMCDWNHLTPIDLKTSQKVAISRSNSAPNQQTLISKETVGNQSNNGPTLTQNKSASNTNVSETTTSVTIPSNSQAVSSNPLDRGAFCNISISNPPINNIVFSRSNSTPPSQNAIILNSAFRNQVDNSYNLNQPIPTVNASSNVATLKTCSVSSVQPTLSSTSTNQSQYRFVFSKPQQLPASTTFTTIAYLAPPCNPSLSTLSNQLTNAVVSSVPLTSKNAVALKFPCTISMHSLPKTTPIVNYTNKGSFVLQNSNVPTATQVVYQKNQPAAGQVTPQKNYSQNNLSNTYSSAGTSAIRPSDVTQFLNSTTSSLNQIAQNYSAGLVPVSPSSSMPLLEAVLSSTTTSNPSINSQSASVAAPVKTSASVPVQYAPPNVNYVFNSPTNLNSNVSNQSPSKPIIRVKKLGDLT